MTNRVADDVGAWRPTAESGDPSLAAVTGPLGRPSLEHYVAELPHIGSRRIRYWNRILAVLGYYPSPQIVRRVTKTLLNKAGWNRIVACPPVSGLQLHAPALQDLSALAQILGAAQPHLPRVRELDWRAGTIRLLNEVRPWTETHAAGPLLKPGETLRWDFSGQARPPHLWRFQLHYHEYLLDLAIQQAQADPAWWDVIWHIVSSWIDQHPPERMRQNGDPWHPYCISRRVPVWLMLLSLHAPPAPLRDRILSSLYRQSEYLSRHLELDLRGNHLLENLRGLAIAAATLDFPSSEPWLDLVADQLIPELSVQVLPSGEHFERSSMYHCQIISDIAQIAIMTRRARPELSERCRETLDRMLNFLLPLLHPDGEIPLFADSGFGEAPNVAQLRQLSSLASVTPQPVPPRQIGWVGEYWVVRQPQDQLIFDTGNVGTDSLPAHAHCDLLGLEASLGGERWFVDSGNFNYQADSMRAYCRSSAAHNVVTLAGQNQCDIWSKFRMGSRGHVLDRNQGVEQGVQWARASHNAYRRLGIARMDRLVAVDGRGVWSCVDFRSGRHNLELRGFLHLHPTVQIEQVSDIEFILSRGDLRRRLTFAGTHQVFAADGWYCPAFGTRTPTTVLVYDQPAGGLGTIGWIQQPLNTQVKLTVGKLFTTEWMEDGKSIFRFGPPASRSTSTGPAV